MRKQDICICENKRGSNNYSEVLCYHVKSSQLKSNSCMVGTVLRAGLLSIRDKII